MSTTLQSPMMLHLPTVLPDCVAGTPAGGVTDVGTVIVVLCSGVTAAIFGSGVTVAVL